MLRVALVHEVVGAVCIIMHGSVRHGGGCMHEELKPPALLRLNQTVKNQNKSLPAPLRIETARSASSKPRSKPKQKPARVCAGRARGGSQRKRRGGGKLAFGRGQQQ